MARPVIPRPRPPGACAAGLAVCALAGGAASGEGVLLLTGGLLACLLLYTFAAAAVMSALWRPSAARLSASLWPDALAVPAETAARFDGAARRAALPACLARRELDLRAATGRSVRALFPPALFDGERRAVAVKERGLFRGAPGGIVIFDGFGFWRCRLPSRAGELRLAAAPAPYAGAGAARLSGGGDEEARMSGRRKSADPLDSRPYVPGDDPRRINWKLYAHAARLFVRDGEPAEKRALRLTLILDGETDRALLGPAAALDALDLLCAAARALADDARLRGAKTRIYATGERGGEPLTAEDADAEGGLSDVAIALAAPAPLPLGAARLPEAAAREAALYLALPRSAGGGGPGGGPLLERFLAGRAPDAPPLELCFAYGASGGAALEAAAAENARMYGRRPGVHARTAAL